MTYTLAITTYNRFDLLLESFADIIHDPRIDEVLIVDDCSELKYWNKIKELPAVNPKIKVIRQAQNRGMSLNKAHAVSYSKNEWVILFDSDNVLRSDYLDSFPATLDPKTIYMPSFAQPNFDYREFEGITFDRATVKNILQYKNGEASLNTCNYLVNKTEYLKAYSENKAMKATDTIYFNYLWLLAGNKFNVVPNMQYFHRVHRGSFFLEDVNYNMLKSQEIKKMIESL